MEFARSKEVEQLIDRYPTRARERLLELRKLILDTAKEIDGLHKLLETTKWGEPSYVTKTGSTVRMDWKKKTPDKYYLFFICSTELVNTFRIIFGEELQFEGNRAIVLNLNEALPTMALKRCIHLALNYHKLKHLPILGA
ncbi:MAG: DUF1801 domain-containing protein [Bacteroidota bacterium]